MRVSKPALTAAFAAIGMSLTAALAQEAPFDAAVPPNKEFIAQMIQAFEQGRFDKGYADDKGTAFEYIDNKGQVTPYHLIDVTVLQDHMTCIAFSEINLASKATQTNFICVSGWVSAQAAHMRQQNYIDAHSGVAYLAAQGSTLAPIVENTNGYVVVSNLTGREKIREVDEFTAYKCRELGVTWYLPGSDGNKAAVNHMPEAINPERPHSVCVRRSPAANTLMIKAG